MKPLDSIVVTDVLSAMTVASHQGRNEVITSRVSYGLSFCITGQITYTHKGVNYVSKKGYAIILPKGETYQLYGDKKGSFPVINFDTAEHLCNTPCLIPIDDEGLFLTDYAGIRSCLRLKKSRAKVMSLFYGILHKLSPAEKDVGILLPAIEYIEKNYSSHDVSNTALAKLCNVSEVYFRKLFLQKMNTTPKQYLLDLRLSKAKELLAEGTLKVSAVAEYCGFTNPYHFCRTFKDRMGMTPGEYARKNKVYKI